MINWSKGYSSYIPVRWQTKTIEIDIDKDMELLRGTVLLRSSKTTSYFDNISLITDFEDSTAGTNISIWEVTPKANVKAFVFITPINIELIGAYACFDSDITLTSDCTTDMYIGGTLVGTYTLKANEQVTKNTLVNFVLVSDLFLDPGDCVTVSADTDLPPVKIVLLWRVGDKFGNISYN